MSTSVTSHRSAPPRWRDTSRLDRGRLILDALAEDQLTVTQLAARMTHCYPGLTRFTYPLLYPVVRSMLQSGELDSVSEPWRKRTRSFVFRTAASGPADYSVDL